ncbi:CGNR zinc finger domain-containing protein [Streptomyces sp. APSN-46.1]|uniref:CGNR zinc finger domain-containing protein n=1 Tax=Streptomyces sp. APSN-46.1 TaxID=2929049 RepID=UPI001FB43C99|nr:CGNR zinc finger domain-containing protein [Streptomyces sp. APSN-46.1]MCJ1678965.1 CGNR zinc finger domain-containing protein [Streptomyces sp. APSN-46.1]
MTVIFPLVGEPLALDLLNTRPAGVGDLIADPAGLAAWLAAQAGRVTPLPAVGAAEVAAVHAVREAAGPALAAVRRGARPPAGALRALNEALAAAPVHRELAWTAESGLAVASRRAAAPPRRLAAELAEAVADLLADPRVGEVRECEGADCVLLFLPAHPRRRWCVASACGNRARVARYYARHAKGAETA